VLGQLMGKLDRLAGRDADAEEIFGIHKKETVEMICTAVRLSLHAAPGESSCARDTLADRCRPDYCSARRPLLSSVAIEDPRETCRQRL
jgi:hypothetical protein